MERCRCGSSPGRFGGDGPHGLSGGLSGQIVAVAKVTIDLRRFSSGEDGFDGKSLLLPFWPHYGGDAMRQRKMDIAFERSNSLDPCPAPIHGTNQKAIALAFDRLGNAEFDGVDPGRITEHFPSRLDSAQVLDDSLGVVLRIDIDLERLVLRSGRLRQGSHCF